VLICIDHCYSVVMGTDFVVTLRDGDIIHSNFVGTCNRDTCDNTAVLILYFTIFMVFKHGLCCTLYCEVAEFDVM